MKIDGFFPFSKLLLIQKKNLFTLDGTCVLVVLLLQVYRIFRHGKFTRPFSLESARVRYFFLFTVLFSFGFRFILFSVVPFGLLEVFFFNFILFYARPVRMSTLFSMQINNIINCWHWFAHMKILENQILCRSFFSNNLFLIGFFLFNS